ncbi:MAG: cytochrome C [Chloroflexi bacterium]|nr:cytochrome C [Chloroflexota bacterium]
MKFSLDSDVKVLLPDGSTHHLSDYLWPNALLMLAALLITISMFLPYWSMTLKAPQYPKGLTVSVYVNRLQGDMREIDELNHYLGMPELDKGGQLERSISVAAIVVLGLLLLAGVFVHNQWAAVLALPVLGYPIIFLADLWYILYQYGHSIDPKSALGGAIKPFTPPLFGEGKVGQFGTVASFEIGFYLVVAAVVVMLAGLWTHRAAYKPLADARKRVRAGQTQSQTLQAQATHA